MLERCIGGCKPPFRGIQFPMNGTGSVEGGDDANTPMCWICRIRPTAKASTFEKSICPHCNNVGTQSYDEAWRTLSRYLHEHWREIIGRGTFDLSKAFAGDSANQALRVQLHFVKLLGCKLKDDEIGVNLDSFSTALLGCVPHPEVTLMVANSLVGPGQVLLYQSDVSVLRDGQEVLSAVWMYLAHPVAIKVCYIKQAAPVRPPEGFPWHPTRQRKIVKISPYKGDVEPLVARRDLRI